jgi:acyl-CoA synthetase (AMP-forming)/AMP-acid ligase II
VVRKPGVALTENEVRRFALENAPAYQHPRGVVFMTELPLASTNKVDRKALGALARQHWSASGQPNR